MGNGKRILAIMGAVVILGGSGYAIVQNSPYNNKNITFINRNLDEFSKEMDNFIKNDFNKFDEIMHNLQSGNYDSCTYVDINELDKYINTILSCNFKSYEDEMWKYRDRDKSGFLIEFENYFPSGSEERELIEKFSGYFEKIIRQGYRYVEFNAKKIVDDCTADYHKLEFQIHQLPAFPKYIVLKLVRPIIEKNDFQYYPYYKRSETLAKIDSEISKCMWTMQKQCANPDLNYNVSRR